MLMSKVDSKFNSAIVFAPACCGPRHEINKYPKWRKEIRPKQVKEIDTAAFCALLEIEKEVFIEKF